MSRPFTRRMDRDCAVAAHRGRRDRLALPFGIAIGWLLARKEFWGKTLVDGTDLFAAGAAAGRHRLSAAGDVRTKGAGRRVAGRPLRRRPVVPLDRRGAVMRRHGFPADGAPDPPGARIDRSPRRGRRGDARCQPFWCFVTITLPLALPGVIAGVVLCFARALGEFGATITFVSNIPGETQTHVGRDLQSVAGSERRCVRPGAS